MQTDLMMWQPLMFEPRLYGSIRLKLDWLIQPWKVVVIVWFSCRLCNSFQPEQTQNELQLITHRILFKINSTSQTWKEKTTDSIRTCYRVPVLYVQQARHTLATTCPCFSCLRSDDSTPASCETCTGQFWHLQHTISCCVYKETWPRWYLHKHINNLSAQTQITAVCDILNYRKVACGQSMITTMNRNVSQWMLFHIQSCRRN